MADRMQMQYAYQCQQNVRVACEYSRSANACSAMPRSARGGRGDFAAMPAGEFLGGDGQIEDVPDPEECIGQAVLDWEFIHDLDLHLFKVAKKSAPGRVPEAASPSKPKTDPAPPSDDAGDLADHISDDNEFKLGDGATLSQLVSYSSKVLPARDGGKQAVLQLDRNAAVHSHKPVENLYLTDKLEPGIYAVVVHNFSQRGLKEGIVGTGRTYANFDEFKKGHPGYVLMEKALQKQIDHAGDPDGTPEKQEIMSKVDQEMAEGSSLIRRDCCAGDINSGVHYGLTVYTYKRANGNSKHPQAASMEELQEDFQSDFFATADLVFNPDPAANPTGYNGGSTLANKTTEDGKLALGNTQGAVVSLFKVQKNEDAKSFIADVRVLGARPGAMPGSGDASGPPYQIQDPTAGPGMGYGGYGGYGDIRFPPPQELRQTMPPAMQQRPPIFQKLYRRFTSLLR